VKAALKPYYAVGKITKDEYKDVMRSAVPKVKKIGSTIFAIIATFCESFTVNQLDCVCVGIFCNFSSRHT